MKALVIAALALISLAALRNAWADKLDTFATGLAHWVRYGQHYDPMDGE